MGGPCVRVAGESHEASPFGAMWRLALRGSCGGERSVGALVGHYFPQPLRGRQDARSELDPELASHEAAEGSTEAGIRRDSDVGERGGFPQRAEPAEHSLDASSLCRSKGVGRGPGHARRC